MKKYTCKISSYQTMVLYWISTLYLTKIICSTIWIEVPLQWTEKRSMGILTGVEWVLGLILQNPKKQGCHLNFMKLAIKWVFFVNVAFLIFWCFSNLSKTLNLMFLDIKHGNPGIKQGESNDWLIDEEIEKGIQYNTCPCLCLDRNK